MDTILITLIALVGAVAGVAAMVHFVQHDSFAGPGLGHQRRDELGRLGDGRRAA